MDALQKVFEYQGTQVRTVLVDGEPWFVAKDVCDILEIDTSTSVNGRMRRNEKGQFIPGGGLDEDEKGTAIVSTPGGPQELLVVSEPGLYSLILKSRKGEAKAFRRWITHEVIPAIRKTGSYIAPATPTSIEDLIIMQARSVKELKAQVAALEETARAAEEKAAIAHHRIDTLDAVNIIGDMRQRFNAMIRKYAQVKGLTFSQAYRDFTQDFNTAYRTNLVLLMTNYKPRKGAKKLTIPEYLDQTGKLEDALRVADKMLNQGA